MNPTLGTFCCSVYGGKYNISVIADPETNSYDGKISGNILVLGSLASGKTTLVEEMASNSMFGKLKDVHWVSAVKISKVREAEIDSCFQSKVEFYNPQDEYDLKKNFCRLRKSLQRKTRKEKNCCRKTRSPNFKGYVSRQQLWLINLVRTLAKKSGYSCFCLDKRPHMFSAARYRS